MTLNANLRKTPVHSEILESSYQSHQFATPKGPPGTRKSSRLAPAAVLTHQSTENIVRFYFNNSNLILTFLAVSVAFTLLFTALAENMAHAHGRSGLLLQRL